MSRSVLDFRTEAEAGGGMLKGMAAHSNARNANTVRDHSFSFLVLWGH